MEIPSAYAAGYQAARKIDAEAADAYIRHTKVGDPPADRVVEDLATADPPINVHAAIAAALNTPMDPPENVPESLRELVSDLCVVPDWYDPELARRASLAFVRNSNIVPAALAGAAIVEGFSTLISKSFRVRGRVIDNGIRRLRQNLLHLADQYLPGGMEPAADGWRLTLRIRLVHAQSRRLILRSDEWDHAMYGMPISIAHVLLASTTFSARLIQHCWRLGANFSDVEAEAYVHVWRYTAYILGVPEPLLFGSMADALRQFEVGMACEPVPDEDAIIMANSIVNSAPLLLGYESPTERRPLAKYIYQVCRELIGDELADHFLFPPHQRIKQVWLLRLENRARRVLPSRLLAWMKDRPDYDYMKMLRISDVGDTEQSYRLPTALHDEDSQPW